MPETIIEVIKTFRPNEYALATLKGVICVNLNEAFNIVISGEEPYLKDKAITSIVEFT